MARPKETFEKRLSRHLPGIDFTQRNDPNCWPWKGKFKWYNHHKPIQKPMLGNYHVVRYILSYWSGEPLHRMILTRNVCGNTTCANPYHYVLQGCRFNREDDERWPVPYHESMTMYVSQSSVEEDVKEAIEAIDSWETMSVDDLAVALRGICTLGEIIQCLKTTT